MAILNQYNNDDFWTITIAFFGKSYSTCLGSMVNFKTSF